jgi:hypothetical protein
MFRVIALVSVMAFAFSAANAAAPCKDPMTGKFIMCPPPAAATTTTTTTGSPPHCVKGKLCGNSCIAQNKVCHQPTH